MIKKYDSILKEMRSAQNIAVFGHINTDGDSVGACLGLKYFLEGMGKNVDIFCDSIIPDQLTFLPDIDTFNKKNHTKYDLSIAVDTFQDRLGKFEKDFFNAKKTILIDHHVGNANFANINLIEPTTSSVCAMLFALIKYSGTKFSNKLATVLLTGILTDTGGLKFSNTSSQTLSAVAELSKYSDLSMGQLNKYLFSSQSHGYFEIFKKAIYNTEFYHNNKLVFIHLSESDFLEAKIDFRNVKDLAKIGTDLKDTVVTIVVSESKKNEYQVSFRSNGEVDVRKCAEVFGGGGHKMASGCKVFGRYESIKEKLIKAATDEMQI